MRYQTLKMTKQLIQLQKKTQKIAHWQSFSPKNYLGVNQGFPFPLHFHRLLILRQAELADIPFVADSAGILDSSRRHTFRTFRSSQTYLTQLADIIIVVFLINYLITKNINGLLHLIFFCHISPVAYIATKQSSKQSSQAYLSYLILPIFFVADF